MLKLFINSWWIWQSMRTPALAEIAELKSIAQQDGIEELKPWDATYYSEKLKQQQFNLSQEALKPYFPAPKVVDGLFQIVQRLYGIQIIERQALFGKMMYVILKLKIKVKWSVVSILTYMPVTANAVAHG
jgi:Zn-dependent oligopeptidase